MTLDSTAPDIGDDRTPVLSIMLTDDSQTDCSLTQEAPSTANLCDRLTVFDCAEDGRRFLRKNGHTTFGLPHVISLDLNMPSISGRESHRFHANRHVVKPLHYDAFANKIVSLGHFWGNAARQPSVPA